MTTDIKELVKRLRAVRCGPIHVEAADALETMAGEVERLKKEAAVHEDEMAAMTGGMYADMKIKAQLTAERDRLKAALEDIGDHNRHGWTLQTEIAHKALGDAS